MKYIDYLRLAKDFIFKPEKVSLLPRHLQLDITTSCNLNCTMCYAKRALRENERNKSISLEQYKMIIDAIKPLSINLAASGEPFLNKELPEMIRYAREHGAKTIISTNFVAPDRAMIERVVDSGLDIMKISIDGASPEVYSRVRGPHMPKLEENIGILNELISKRPGCALSARIDFVILKTNTEDIDRIVQFAGGHNIRHVVFRVCDARGWTEQDKTELLKESFALVEEKLDKALLLAKKLGIKTNLPELIEKKELWRFRHDGAPSRIPAADRPVCMLPWFQLFVSALGDTSFCCGIYPSRDKNMGNVFANDIRQSLKSDEWLAIRRLFKEKKNYEMFEGCKYCIPMSADYLVDVVKMFPGFIGKK